MLACAVVVGLPALVACNSIIGLSDFEKGECPGARCGDGGAFPDQFVEAGGDVLERDAQPDVKGAAPVSWAKWPMPNYGDGGAGEPPRPPNLTVAGDTVTDETTKLVWRSKLAPPGGFNALQADVECKKLAPAGSWRAPKRIELVTLLDYAKGTLPFISPKFTDVANDVVWTTSEVRPFVVGKPDQLYWVVNFGTGAVEQLPANLKGSVLCVANK